MDSLVKRSRLFDSLQLRNRVRSHSIQPLRLTDLPVDILIIVLSQCRIDEIFALRLTSSIFRNVFSMHSPHIIPSVACCTFPRSELLLQPSTASAGYTFDWLKSRIPHQLAAILVDRHRFIHQQGPIEVGRGIPAEDALGDNLRRLVANGWCVLGKLSNIAKDVYKMDGKEVLSVSGKKALWRRMKASNYEIEMVRLKEEMIMQQRLQYVRSESTSMLEGYIIMFTLLSGAWRVRKASLAGAKHDPRWPFDFGHGIDASRMIRRGESWITWFIFDRGPELFWEQWQCLPSEASETASHVRDCAIEAFFAPLPPEGRAANQPDKFVDPHEEVHKIQRQCARKVQQALSEQTGGTAQILHLEYFRHYAEDTNRIANDSGDKPAIVETMSNVPFFIDFAAYKRA